MKGFEAVKEAVLVYRSLRRELPEREPEVLRRLVGWCLVRDALKEMCVERVRQQLMRWIAAPQIVGIPNLDERAAEAALAWDGLLPVAQMLVARTREGHR